MVKHRWTDKEATVAIHGPTLKVLPFMFAGAEQNGWNNVAVKIGEHEALYLTPEEALHLAGAISSAVVFKEFQAS